MDCAALSHIFSQLSRGYEEKMLVQIEEFLRGVAHITNEYLEEVERTPPIGSVACCADPCDVKIPAHYVTPNEFVENLNLFCRTYITSILSKGAETERFSINKGGNWYFDAMALIHHVKDSHVSKANKRRATAFCNSSHDMRKLQDFLDSKVN